MAKQLRTAPECDQASPLEQVILSPKTGRVSPLRASISALVLALVGGLTGEVAGEFKEAMRPSFPSHLTPENIGLLTGLTPKAVDLCEKPNGGPQTLQDWVPTRNARIADLGLTPKSYHFCAGKDDGIAFELRVGRVGFQDEFFANPWILEDVHQVDEDTQLVRFGIDTVFNGHVDHWAVAETQKQIASTGENPSVDNASGGLSKK